MREARDGGHDRNLAREIEYHCLDIFVRFYRHLDAGEYQSALDLWHPKGTWYRERALTKPEMLEALREGSNTAIVHHIVTNAIFDVSDEQVSFSAYVTSISAQRGQPPKATAPADGMRLYLCRGELLPTQAGWRMSSYMLGEPRIELLRPGALVNRVPGDASADRSAGA